MIAEDVFVNCYNWNHISQKRQFSRYLIKPTGAAIWICGSTEPEPKEIISTPQPCRNVDPF